MRARNIKPGYLRNEDLAACSIEARYLGIGLTMLADREGRLEDRPLRIKAELLPFDSIDVQPLLAELDRAGFIHRYEVKGQRLIQVVKFAKHQNPHHREAASVLPASPGLAVDTNPAEPEADDSSITAEPEAGPGLDPPTGDMARGENRADSQILRFSDSGTTDSGTTDALIPEKQSVATPPPPPAASLPGKRAKPRRKPRTAGTPLDERFAMFWAYYPRRVARAEALKAFSRLEPTDELVDKMVAAIKAQGLQKKFDGPEKRFVAHPATWLNGRRWEDEVSAEPTLEPTGGGKSAGAQLSFKAKDAVDAKLRLTSFYPKVPIDDFDVMERAYVAAKFGCSFEEAVARLERKVESRPPRGANFLWPSSKGSDDANVVEMEAPAPKPALAVIAANDASGIPYAAIIDAYHDKLPELPRVVDTNDGTRLKAIEELWHWILKSTRSDGKRRAETPEEAFQWIAGYFDRCSRDDVVTGRTRHPNASPGWRATFDYVIGEIGRGQVLANVKAAA